jgi:hypothetical protein
LGVTLLAITTLVRGHGFRLPSLLAPLIRVGFGWQGAQSNPKKKTKDRQYEHKSKQWVHVNVMDSADNDSQKENSEGCGNSCTEKTDKLPKNFKNRKVSINFRVECVIYPKRKHRHYETGNPNCGTVK